MVKAISQTVDNQTLAIINLNHRCMSVMFFNPCTDYLTVLTTSCLSEDRMELWVDHDPSAPRTR